ncbi:hypothetical protein D3C87_166580 [compost metagenome]
MVIGMGQVKGQRTYGTTYRFGKTQVLGSSAKITSPEFATDAIYTNAAQLEAASTLGQSTAWEQLIFASPIPAKSTVYIKLKVLTTSLLGNEITVDTYSGSTGGAPGVEGTPVTSTSTDLLTAANGDQYILVTPTTAINSVKITLKSPVALGTNTIDLYYAYYEQPGTGCSDALLTSTSVTGIALLGSVTAPNNAIDNNLTTNSTLNVGLLGLGSSIKQMVYFSSLSKTGDATTVTFSVPSALLTLDLFNGITLTAYNGPTQVGTPIAFSSVLSLNLLFLGAGNIATLSFVPTDVFDRVEISTSSAASVLGSLNLYEVQRTPPKPTFSTTPLQNPTICSGSPVTLTPVTPASGNELRWYSSLTATSALTTANTYTPSPNLTATTTYYVATAKTGCSAESERVPVIVTVNTITPGTIATNQTICHGDTPAAFTASVGVGAGTISYQWQKSTDNITFNNITSATIATYAETTALNQTTYYRRIDTSTLNTVVCSANTNVLTITINPKPPSPHIVIITNSQY